MIRMSKTSDYDAIMELWLVATLQSHDFISAGVWWQHQAQISSQYLDNADIWVCENNGKLTGFFAINNRTLTALFTHPDTLKSGLRQQLLQKAKSLRTKLKLHIYIEDEETIRFYLDNGFRIIKQQIEKISGQPELIMTFSRDIESNSFAA